MRNRVSHIIAGLAVVVVIAAIAACPNPLINESLSKKADGNLSIQIAWPVLKTAPVYSKYQVPLEGKDQVASPRSVSKAIGLNVAQIFIEVYDSRSSYYSATLDYTLGQTTAIFGASTHLPSGSASITVWAYDSDSILMGYGTATATVPSNGSQASVSVVLKDRYNYWYSNNSMAQAVNVATSQLYEDFSINSTTEEDWYYFYANSGQSYTVDTSGANGTGYGRYQNNFDNVVEIYDPYSTYVTTGTGIADVATFTANYTGSYYIKVRSSGYTNPTGNYALYISGNATAKILIQTVHAYDNSWPGFGGNWVEFYNPSATTATNLSNYAVYLNGYYWGTLPSYTLQPQQRVRVVDPGTTIPSGVTDWVASTYYYWGSWGNATSSYNAVSGSIEIIDYTTWLPVDFVSWGSSGYTPQYNNTFTHNNSFYLDGTLYGYAVERIWDMNTRLPIDTDDASDFRVGPYAGSPSPAYNIGQTAYGLAYTSKTPTAIQGHLNSGDYHWYVVYNSTNSSQTVEFVTYRPAGGTYVDTFVELYDSLRASSAPVGNDRGSYALAFNDDSGEGTYSHMTYTLAAWGTYWLRIHSYAPSSVPSGVGDYTLMIYGPAGIKTTEATGYTTVWPDY